MCVISACYGHQSSIVRTPDISAATGRFTSGLTYFFMVNGQNVKIKFWSVWMAQMATVDIHRPTNGKPKPGQCDLLYWRKYTKHQKLGVNGHFRAS